MKLLLVGKNGQVGFELQRALAPLGELVAVGRAQCDLSIPDEIRKIVRYVKPQIIVNPAGYTNVDGAESDQELAFAVNSTAPGILGEEAKRLSALVVHYSTDYVFDGAKDGAYSECDQPNPKNIYGLSKLKGEEALQQSGADNIIFRTSWVYGAHGDNFVKTMLKLAANREKISVVADQFGAPTSAALIADVTAQILGQYVRCDRSRFPLGLYNMVASSETQWHAFAQAIIGQAIATGKRLKLTPEAVLPVTSAEYPVAAKRPFNSRLNTNKLRKTFGLHLPDWQVGLHHTLNQILQST
jgi:dTDP-4-dehydrorhamnose reductase